MITTDAKTSRFDTIATCLVATMLLFSAVILFTAYARGENLGTWIWDRHQNQFSWYSRPLFIVPACYYAYRQKLWLVIGFMALLGCSLFWFAAPETVPEHVSGYLEWEKQLLFSNESLFPLLVLIAVVVAFLFGLFYAFWRRSPWLGLFLINAGTVIKIFVSVVLGKEAGMAAVVPSLSSMAIINLIAFVCWKYFKRQTQADRA